MSWFKENKFLAGLISITFLLAAAILFFGMKSGSSLTQVQEDIAKKQADLKKMKTLDPFPTIENAKAKEASLKDVLKMATEAREKLLAFRPEKMENVPGKDFSENLSATVARVKELFPEEKALPNNFNLGFEAYSGSLPREEATGILGYQLGAMEFVLTQLAEAGGEQVDNLYREQLPAEKGEDWPDAVGNKRGARGGARGGRPASRGPAAGRPRGGRQARGPKVPTFETLPAVAHRMPFELTFKGPESVVRDFLTGLANSDQYFIETRVARIINPSPIPSAGKSITAENQPEDDFGGPIEIEGFGEDSGDDGAVESVKILDKVSGGDDLVVFLRADLLLFIEEKTLPELK